VRRTLGSLLLSFPPIFSAVIVTGIVATMVTPRALKWSLGRGEPEGAAS
jgi:hypothetical protein